VISAVASLSRKATFPKVTTSPGATFAASIFVPFR
jgi:hypothetical protein